MSPRSHNPKVVGSNPTPATIRFEGLADVEAARPLAPFVYPDFTQELKTAQASALISASRRSRGRNRPWPTGRCRQPVRSEPLDGGRRQLKIGLGPAAAASICQTTLRGQAPKVRRPDHALCHPVETARERGFVPVCARPPQQLLRAPRCRVFLISSSILAPRKESSKRARISAQDRTRPRVAHDR